MEKLTEEEQKQLNNYLSDACYECNFEQVKKLIEQGAEIDTADGSGDYPIESAICGGDLEIVKYLHQNGADKYDGLVNASEIGQLEIVKYYVEHFIEHGGNIDVSDGYGDIALNKAAENGHLDIVKYLIKNGADVTAMDDNYNTAIVLASMGGQLEVVKYFVENGGDIFEGIRGASKGERLDVIEYLIKNGADIDSAIFFAEPNFKEELISYKEKELIKSDLKEIKQEQQKPKTTMRI